MAISAKTLGVHRRVLIVGACAMLAFGLAVVYVRVAGNGAVATNNVPQESLTQAEPGNTSLESDEVAANDLEKNATLPIHSAEPETTSNVILNPMNHSIEVLVADLDTPWEIEFLPDGTLLVAERPGRVTHIAYDGTKTSTRIEGAVTASESGVNGIALDPDFQNTSYVFVYFRAQDGNRVVRYTLADRMLVDPHPIIAGIPAARWHDGGRIAFGPDGLLYITTGDATNPDDAQNTNSLAGKILRIKKDGSIPDDNPFGNAVYSYGHRNPQGLAWDDLGRLWATEHGPSGAETGNDEVNLIVKGGNYGWPVIRGTETREGMIAPVIESTRRETWAPAGLAYWEGSLFFGGLRGETLYETKIAGSSLSGLTRHFTRQYGRIRAVQIGPDGMLYFSTSNRSDGWTGPVDPADDRIIRVNPAALFRS